MNQTIEIRFANERLLLDAAKAVWMPLRRMLIVSDLHFEKGSYLTRYGGHMLPKLDTHDTLQRLKAVIERYQPERVVSLGDSFHDCAATKRMNQEDMQLLHGLCEAVPSWQWVFGNHDPELPCDLPGERVHQLQLEGLLLSHEPENSRLPQIIGHYHPKFSLNRAGHKLSGPCFCVSDRMLIMPSFGSYTGGLNVQDQAIQSLFEQTDVRYYMPYREKLWPLRYQPERPKSGNPA